MLIAASQAAHAATLHIALLIPNLRGGGAERVVLALAEGFLSRGWRVDILLQRRVGGPLLELVPDGAQVIDLAAQRVRHLPGPLRSYLGRHQPDVLIASLWPLTLIAVIAARLLRKRPKLILVDHNNLGEQYRHNRLLRPSIRALYRLADRCVGVSRGVTKSIMALSGLDSSRCRTIYNPVPTLNPGAVPERVEACWRGRSGPRFLTVGSLKPQKNHRLLLRAFARVLKRHPDATLLVLGEGNELSQCRAKTRRLALEQSVTFADFVLDPAPYYASADIFVLSSDFEGFGNVLVEAMQAGLKIVSTDCPSGPSEVLLDGRLGYLVPVGDELALANAMIAAVTTPCDANALRQRAAHFAPARAVERYAALIEEIMT